MIGIETNGNSRKQPEDKYTTNSQNSAIHPSSLGYYGFVTARGKSAAQRILSPCEGKAGRPPPPPRPAWRSSYRRRLNISAC